MYLDNVKYIYIVTYNDKFRAINRNILNTLVGEQHAHRKNLGGKKKNNQTDNQLF